MDLWALLALVLIALIAIAPIIGGVSGFFIGRRKSNAKTAVYGTVAYVLVGLSIGVLASVLIWRVAVWVIRNHIPVA